MSVRARRWLELEGHATEAVRGVLKPSLSSDLTEAGRSLLKRTLLDRVRAP